MYGPESSRSCGTILIAITRITGFSESNFFSGFTQDISRGGVFVATGCPPEIGSEVDVAIQVDDGQEPVILKAEVVWIRVDEYGPTGCGCRFVDCTEEMGQWLEGFLSKLGREPLLMEV